MESLGRRLVKVLSLQLQGSLAPTELAHSWVRERAILRLHWVFSICFAAAVVIVPTGLQPLDISVAALLFLGAALSGSFLAEAPSWILLRQVRIVMTGIEWCAALAVLIIFSRDFASIAPIAANFLVLPTVMRFHRHGILAGIIGASFIAFSWGILHLHIFDTLAHTTVHDLIIAWLLVLPLHVVWIGILIHGDRSIHMWDQRHHAFQIANYDALLDQYRRERSGLSQREWQILEHLEQELTYTQIGHRLSISPETVRTHVRHIGEKLKVSGRRQIVAEAHIRRLLPNAGITTKH